MKVVDHIAKANKTLFSIEILPPLKGQDIKSIFDTIETLMEFEPPFIDVTYHREDFEYKKGPNGEMEKHVVRKRPGTVGICAAIINRFKIDAVPHILCGGFSRQDTEDALIDLNFLGIDNVLALRGDAVKSEGIFKPEPNGNQYASDLVGQISNLNKGIYLHEDLQQANPTNFCIGVAGYPEVHFECADMAKELDVLKQKVALGAEYVVTQMFFDNQKYLDYVAKCRAAGITIPIIPGLKPISTKKQLTLLADVFSIEMPEALTKAVLACQDDAQVKQVGIEWGIAQSLELKKHGVPVLHYYSMGKADAIKAIASKVF
jgi:methylenetetrahydrofolate reductase (NADPH)